MSMAAASALIVAHPGHEIRLHGWLESTSPFVFVLTDGSGRAGKPRIDATMEYLCMIGAKPGSIFGRFTDRAVYQAILYHNFDLFIGLVDELSEALVRSACGYVVGDATEGYNTAHDVCRLMINCSVEAANRSNGHQIANYDYPVVNRPDCCPRDLHERAIWLNLDEPTFKRKVAAAQTYYPELFAEVEESLRDYGTGPLKTYLDHYGEAGCKHATGLDMFRTECLRPAPAKAELVKADGQRQPFYELHGDEQVSSGYYDRTIRFREHILPLAEAISEHLERSS